jgi:hypothetical protein
MALTLGEYRHEHIRAGHLLAARRLDVDNCTVDNPLEARRRLSLRRTIHAQRRKLRVQIFNEAVPQDIEIDVARAHDTGGVAVVDQREQKMLQRGVLVLTLVGVFKRPMEAASRLCENDGKGTYSFSMVH